MVGDEQRVEPEILDLTGELPDATGALRTVALPDVRGQEHAKPADLTHVAVLPPIDVIGRGTRATAWRGTPSRPRAGRPWQRSGRTFRPRRRGRQRGLDRALRRRVA